MKMFGKKDSIEPPIEELTFSYNEQILKAYLKAYNNKVDSKYIHQVKSNPEAFPLYKKNNLKLSIILLNETFFSPYPVILISNDNTAKELYDYREEDNETLSRDYLEYADDSYTYIKDILKPIDFESHIFIFDTISTIRYGDHILDEYTERYIEREAGYSAEDHYTFFKNKMRERLQDKNHDDIMLFNHLDLSDVIQTVKSETFGYQIEQGLEAFKKELYLPAAATFAVAIETLLVEVCVVNNIKHKDSDATMYDKLLEKLKQNKAISYRDKRRIEIAYSLRNVIHHTQAGAIAKEDCEFMLTTIKSIVDSYKDQFVNMRHADEDIEDIDRKIKDKIKD